MKAVYIVACLAIALAYFQGADAFACYVCDSTSNTACADPVLPGVLDQYASFANASCTACTKVSMSIMGVSAVMRTCVPGEGENQGIEGCMNIFGSDICMCKTDLCNGQARIGFTLSALCLVVTTVLYNLFH